MAACNTRQLIEQANCFNCYSLGVISLLRLALLVRILKSVNPAADTSPQALIAQANCFNCYSGATLRMMKLALLCRILGGNGSVGPSIPSGISCNSIFTLGYQINWTNGALPQTAVEVWLKIGGGAYALTATVGPSVNTYTDGGPWGGTTVCGKVRAVNGSQTSDFSTECCVVFP